MLEDGKQILARFAAAASVAAGVMGIASGTAYAAGGGYGPGSGPTPSAPSGYSQTIASQQVGSSGGTVSGTYGGQSFSVRFPAGSLSSNEQITLFAMTGNPTSGKDVAGVDVAITDPTTGAKFTGTFSPSATLTIQSSSIASGDVVEEMTSGAAGFTTVPGTVVNGMVTLQFSTDPAFAVQAGSPSSGVVSGATTAQTGEPFLGEGILAGGLVLLGGAGLIATRRLRRA